MEYRRTGSPRFISRLSMHLSSGQSMATQNNLTQRDLNSADTEFARVGPANFADAFPTPRRRGTADSNRQRRFRVSDANRDAALKSIKGGGGETIIRYFDAFLRFRERHADKRSIP